MKFFKQLKSKLLGSIKEDLNNALSTKQGLFNSKIAGALDDLIAMKTGINISNVPEKISSQALISAEDRRAIQKKTKDSMGFNTVAQCTPNSRKILRFPTDDNRFIDNWIIFRTVKKKYNVEPYIPDASERDFDNGMSNIFGDGNGSMSFGRQDGFGAYGFGGVETGDEGIKSVMMDDYTIALYFPNNVKDSITVDYEAKDVGLSDIAMNEILNNGNVLGVIGEAPSMISEMYQKAKQELIDFESFESGKVVSNPKFNTFSGVGFREHSYSFALNPYNINDAQAITAIIHSFKLLMLPMSAAKNRRNLLMPAEWMIDFKGPILGHIEHPQNCFLKSCEVDYSGGKDMSFIEHLSPSQSAIDDDPETKDIDESRAAIEAAAQHYPNGVVLNLTFTELLNIDRLRYVDRVSPYARGKTQNTQSELNNFEKRFRGKQDADVVEATTKTSTEPEEPRGDPRAGYVKYNGIMVPANASESEKWNLYLDSIYGKGNRPDD